MSDPVSSQSRNLIDYIDQIGTDLFNNLIQPVYTTIAGWISDAVNGVESFVTGFLGPLLTDATDVYRVVITDAFSTVAGEIHNAMVAFIEAKFGIGQWIAQNFNTTLGFWEIIGAVLAGGALAVWLTPTISAFFTTGLGAQWVAAFENITSSVAQVLQLNTFVEINRVAQALFPQWRQIWEGIYQDVETVMGDIGYGFGSISALLTASKAVMVSFDTAMGLPVQTADTTALAEMQDYIQGLSDKFDEYAANPQNIWNDFYENVMLPRMGRINDAFGGLFNAIPDIEKRLDALEALPGDVVKWVNTVASNLGLSIPQSIQGALDALTQVQSDLKDVIDNTIKPALDSMQKSLGPLEIAIDNHNSALDSLNKKVSAIQTDYVPSEDFSQFSAFLQQDANDIGAAIMALDGEVDTDTGDIFQALFVYLTEVDIGIRTVDELPATLQAIYQPPDLTAVPVPGTQKPEDIWPHGLVNSWVQSLAARLSKQSSASSPSTPSTTPSI